MPQVLPVVKKVRLCIVKNR